METVSKYSLNPLATCFIPSSMKYQSITSDVFPVLCYGSSVNKFYESKTELVQNFRNEQTVAECFGVKKLSNPVVEEVVAENPFVTRRALKQFLLKAVVEEVVAENPFVTRRALKQLLSNTVEEEVVAENPFVSAEESKELLSNTVEEEVVSENPFVSAEESKELLSNTVEEEVVAENPFVSAEESKELLSNTVEEEVVAENPFVSAEESKELLSNTVEEEVVTENPFVSAEESKELLSITVEEEVVTENSSASAEDVSELLSITVKEEIVTETSLSTKGVHLTAYEIGKEIAEKLNGEKISKKCSKKKSGSEDPSVKELAKRIPNLSFKGKISELLKAVYCMLLLESCYWLGLNPITRNFTLRSNLFPLFKPSCNAITYPKKTKKTKIEARKINDKVKSEECRCPPMFGWIVPLQFFGNPLKLADTCCKEYVHTSYVDESSRQPQKSDHITLDESSDVNDKAITLDQCSLELKAVIKDVCDSLSSCEQGDEISSQTLVSKTRKRPVWKTETKQEVEMNLPGLEIIDDGFHPLLQEIESEDTDDTDIGSIQKLIGEAFSLHKKDPPLELLPSQSVCNLPCSIWCNKVPPPAKDTYKRFLRKFDSESTENPSKTDVKRKVPKRPLYKRCFSADDTPKSSDHDKMPLLSASSFESRERLLLLRKDPIAFIKQSSTLSSKDGNRKSRLNLSVASEQVFTKDHANESGSDKWSLYDGSDSMWQPLPDCIPSNDSTQKHSHRRVRDMRRQKSVC